VDFLPESNEKSLYLVSHAGGKMDWLIGSAVSASSDSREIKDFLACFACDEAPYPWCGFHLG